MQMRNILRKAAVLGSAVTMVGATIMGAMAYNLNQFPDKFVVDGQTDGKIAVGEKAATPDVLGAIDIAATLQADSVTSEEVQIPGMAGEVSLTGDAFRLETGSDLLEIREVVGDVYDTLTDGELEALRGGSITTDQGNTDYNQYLRFADSSSSTLQKMAVNYVEDEGDTLGDFLVIADDHPFFEWEIEFTEGLESTNASGQLGDLEDEVFNIFGTDFTFVDSTYATPGTSAVTLEFMTGDVSDTLREGETKTYTIDGVDYEVTAVFISDPSAGTPEAKFAVNGELTDSLTDGGTDTLSNGMQIGVRDLLVNSREGVVEFFLGADKVQFYDSATEAAGFQSSGVEIGNENIEDATVQILGSPVGADKYEITSIKYRLTADAKVGSTIYVPAGHGVREFLDEPQGMLSPTFDIEYQGLKDVGTTDIKLDSRSDHSYDLTVTNLRGKTYDFPLLTNKNDRFKWGDDDDDFWFTESTETGLLHNSSNESFYITDDDYFVVCEDDVLTATEKTDCAVLRYDDIDTSDKLLYFTDMSTGESKTVTYIAAASGDSIGRADNFVVEGNTYKVWVGPAPSYPLAVDLDASGSIDGAEVGFTVKGGATIDFANFTQEYSGTLNDSLMTTNTITEMALTVPSTIFDGSSGTEQFNWTVYDSGTNTIDLAVSGSDYSGPNDGANKWDDFDVLNDNNDDDYDRGLTDFGAMIEYYNPSGTNDANELTITFPETQVGAQVFVTAGVTEASEGGAGSVMRDKVNPIAVGLGVLDVDAPALGEENLIIVGGPCANTVAAAFLGNPADCAEGFEAGKAMIVAKEYGDTVAILVAGYEAQETLGASYVLADYDTYLADVVGSEVEVVASDLSDLQVMTPAAEE